METMSLAADRQIRSYNEKLLKKSVTNEQTINPVMDQPALLIKKSESKEPKQQCK
jgi:hypothetical protein